MTKDEALVFAGAYARAQNVCADKATKVKTQGLSDALTACSILAGALAGAFLEMHDTGTLKPWTNE